jgi:enterobacterial common antigen flippase
MKSIFRATAILSGSSIISIILGMVSAKVLALYLQPSGYGYYGLLQSFIGLTTLIAGLGMATGLVRLGAAAAKRNDEQAIANLRGGAWVLFGGVAVIAMAGLTLFRVAISRWALGTPEHGWTIVAMGFALLFTIAGNIQIGILNAYHRVTSLAKYGVINTLFASLITICAVILWQTRGVVPAIIAGAVLTYAASRYFIHRELGAVKAKPTRAEAVKSAWDLLRFGAPFTASSLVGAGVQLALPMVVVHLLNPESVGYYKAATAISVGYLGFLVTAMGQDYYPRLSAVADKPKELVKLINEQHRLVMLLGVPMILGMLALLPVFIPLVYSNKFTPTVEILEWQLIGDLFKFSSWTMSFAVLARCKSSVYFLMESIGGVATIVTTWLAVRWLGLPGLGVGFLASYFVYYAAVWITIRREVPLVWTPRNKQMMLGALAAAFVVRLMPATRFAAYRTPVALTFAFAVGIPSLLVIWREFMASKEPEMIEVPAVKNEAKNEEVAVKV